MQYRLLDVLACPICHGFPFRLVIFEDKKDEKGGKPMCQFYCGYLGKKIEKNDEIECDKCVTDEIISGVLLCDNCKRWYPIKNSIPELLPDNLRDAKTDNLFLEENEQKLDKEVLKTWLPFHL